mmetsp:Transcript_99878/g.311152  ORF Transcript_99878/g.311152 Transcript_99878/m.311152 type:complete len:240 (-) Transcript_99878:1222-1941(-)
MAYFAVMGAHGEEVIRVLAAAKALLDRAVNEQLGMGLCNVVHEFTSVQPCIRLSLHLAGALAFASLLPQDRQQVQELQVAGVAQSTRGTPSAGQPRLEDLPDKRGQGLRVRMRTDQVARHHLLQHATVALSEAAAEQDVAVRPEGRISHQAERADVSAQEPQRVDGKLNCLHLRCCDQCHKVPRWLLSFVHHLSKLHLKPQEEGLVDVQAPLHHIEDLLHVRKISQCHLALLVNPHHPL